MAATAQRVTFNGSLGEDLAARLDLPAGPVRAYALFAHCFTCSKDIFAAARIAGELSKRGIAVLRFDFTGLGQSGGDFANTNFSSNVADLLKAVDFLRARYEAPRIMIGHSLGGAAVLTAAGDVPELAAIVTIGAPADAEHVVHNFHADVSRIESEGEAKVSLAGRDFTIKKQFLDDLKGQAVPDRVGALRKALLVMHSPRDDTVGIDNARRIYDAAKHPKSFVSLDTADHLLRGRADAVYAAEVIASWASRYIGAEEESTADITDQPEVTVMETGGGKFQQAVKAGRHRLLADEPESFGGLDTGPTPYDFLSTGLGACTAMTIRMYAERKGIPLERVSVDVNHGKLHAADCEECTDEQKERGGKIDRFERAITLEGDLDEATRKRLLEIADKCPVHRTLEAGAAVVTREKS